MTNKEIIAKLESELEQLREWGQECLKNDPNHPRNHFKYTIGCSGANDDLYTHSLKKAKILCLEMCQKYGCLATCLLYTSPSPRDSCASRMPSSA